MPSHLRNGKDLSFEQLHAAQIAAEREAERARQQQRLVEIAGRQGASEQPSANNQYGPNELPSSVNRPHSVEQASAVNHSSASEFHRAAELPIAIGYQADKRPDPASHRSAAEGYPPVGYTLSPAALERLRCSSEQQPNILAGQLRSPQDNANLPGSSPFGGFLQGNLSNAGFQPVKASPPSSGEAAHHCHELRRPDSLDGQAYDADTDSPLSPHELSSLESRAVHQSLASHSNRCPDDSQAADRDRSHRGYRDASACLPGSYTSPRLPRAASASSVPPTSPDGRLYKADAKTPVNPDLLDRPRNVYQPVAPQPDHSQKQRDLSQHRKCPPSASVSAARPASAGTLLPNSHHRYRESPHRVPRLYDSSWLSSTSGASTTTPATASAAVAHADRSFANAAAASTEADSTRYWTPARHTATGQAEASTSPALLQARGSPQARATLPSAANFTPYQTSPLRRAVPKKWEPAQPHLPEELETPRTEEAAATRKPEKHSSFNLSPTSLSN
ncbi:hypothetical protein PCANC_12598 [Puccinia coronata f. sp. avenae]|uniref:Uncharacterized protein n=1 Tax=Puccinia coronata f. sp. avenae TaxID=200324 RepID=A0A2N5UNA1_9BASI|nr:hypothetical protein PCANC_12598 [Puccinia coronata f. sp. avenae]